MEERFLGRILAIMDGRSRGCSTLIPTRCCMLGHMGHKECHTNTPMKASKLPPTLYYKDRLERWIIQQVKALGFFDGVSQGNPSPCGAGVILFFWYTLNLVRGTNIWVELKALASLLRITIGKDIVELKVFGDSGVVVDWMHGILRVLNIGLPFFLTGSKTFKHVFRKHNTKADELVETRDEINISHPSRQIYDWYFLQVLVWSSLQVQHCFQFHRCISLYTPMFWDEILFLFTGSHGLQAGHLNVTEVFSSIWYGQFIWEW